MPSCLRTSLPAPAPARTNPGGSPRTYRLLRRCGAAGLLAWAFTALPAGAQTVSRPWGDPYADPFIPVPQGISRLAPAQSYPVRPPTHRIRTRELPAPVVPDLGPDGDAWVIDPLTAGSVPIQDGEIVIEQQTPADDELFGPLYDWRYHYVWDPDAEPVEIVSSAARTARRLSPLAGMTGLQYAQHGWTYRQAGGPALSVGTVQPNAPRWGSAATLGGVQLSRWSGAAGSVLPEGELGYSSTVGLLDYSSGTAATTGDLVYGPSAGGGSMRYGLTPGFTVESQLQKAPDMTAMGFGGVYSAGEWGTVQAGATQGQMSQLSGWRYQVGYNVAFGDDLTLGYQGVTTEAGYGDLAGYAGGPLAAETQRNTVTAGLPLGGYGTFSGTYTGLRAAGVVTEQRVGVQHSLDLTSRTRFVMGANRDAASGAYQMLMQLTLPVDVLSGSLLR